ncbi:hypothetical protein SH528x_000247 [Novipirellula sp. SH528]|uniref:hypothetical protein n=1 Tax=Novipirellula sp. SH528 TaxID=3454466 RepID=UPI003FA06A96
MSYQITEFTNDHVDAVKAFNARLKAGGIEMQYPDQTIPNWLPPLGEQLPNQRYYVALDHAEEVRGGYILKHQAFKIGDNVVPIADLRLPISEGIIDRAHANLGVEILFNSLSKQKLLFGMGIGGEGEAVAQLFKAGGWRISSIPFFFKVVHPFKFCRNIRFLRRTPLRRIILDAAAFSGLGWIAANVAQRIRHSTPANQASVKIEQVDQFTSWADQVWADCKEHYGMIAVRDTQVLQRLYPTTDPRFLRLKLSDASGVIGWMVVINTLMSGHKQFGTLRVGSVVDALATPENSSRLVQAATQFLTERGVDLIVSNQAHRDWCKGFQTAGYLSGPSNYLFASSRALTRQIDAANVNTDHYYINRGDGDGPINL